MIFGWRVTIKKKDMRIPMYLYRKLLSAILAVAMLLSLCLFTISCAPDIDTDPSTGNGGAGTQTPSGGENKDPDKTILVPSFKEYPDRNTVKYTEMEYKRPNFDATIADFEDVVHAIEKNVLSYDEQLTKIHNLYDGYSKIETAYALIQLKQNQNSLDEQVNEEHAFVSAR